MHPVKSIPQIARQLTPPNCTHTHRCTRQNAECVAYLYSPEIAKRSAHIIRIGPRVPARAKTHQHSPSASRRAGKQSAKLKGAERPDIHPRSPNAVCRILLMSLRGPAAGVGTHIGALGERGKGRRVERLRC